MCLALIALDAHPRYRAGHRRQPRRVSTRGPRAARRGGREGWLAGRDLEAGGTWLGVTRHGRVRSSPTSRARAARSGRAVAREARHARARRRRAARAKRSRRSSPSGGVQRLQSASPATRRARCWGSNRAAASQPLARRHPRRLERTARYAVAEGRADEGGTRSMVRSAAQTTSKRCSPCSATARARPTASCRRPASRSSGSGCFRRRSSSAKPTVTARAARRSSRSAATARAVHRANVRLRGTSDRRRGFSLCARIDGVNPPRCVDSTQDALPRAVADAGFVVLGPAGRGRASGIPCFTTRTS